MVDAQDQGCSGQCGNIDNQCCIPSGPPCLGAQHCCNGEFACENLQGAVLCS